MTEREAQIEALWTYTISQEKTLRRLVQKGYMSQEEADRFSNLLYEQLNMDNIVGFRTSHLGEIMRAQSVSIPYTSLTEIAHGKPESSPSYLIQSWLRNKNTTNYLRLWEKKYNSHFDEEACNTLLEKVHTTSVTLTPTLWINVTGAIGICTFRGKGGGTTAHPDIAEMFRVWLFPEFMYELVQWYRGFVHMDHK